MFSIEQGDILKIEHIKGYVLVVSNNIFNQYENVIVRPISKNQHETTLHILIETLETKRTVWCEQLKLMDPRVRGFSEVSFWESHRFQIGPILKSGKSHEIVVTGDAVNIYINAKIEFGMIKYRPFKISEKRRILEGRYFISGYPTNLGHISISVFRLFMGCLSSIFPLPFASMARMASATAFPSRRWLSGVK